MHVWTPGHQLVTTVVCCLLMLIVYTKPSLAATSESSHPQRSVTHDGDILRPYLGHHGPVHRRLRDTQECQHVRYGNTTYSLHPAHKNQSTVTHLADVRHKIVVIGTPYYDQRVVTLRFQRVYNPRSTFSVMEPEHPGSCGEEKDVRASVQETAATRDCVVATNAGFFDTHTGACLGNIVCDGKLVQDSGGIQNVHFGITKDGNLFTGYLSEIELVTLSFQQLVGGVIWLVRDGDVYVDESRDIECPDTQETGPLDTFINVMSARTAVGHDSEGRVLMAQLNGKTNLNGANLHEFAVLLKELGFVNAINLDGGGSATSVINGTLVNYPSDSCDDHQWNCARAVSTILCVHDVECSPPDCSGHGRCVAGDCHCRSHWSGPACDTLVCPQQCSQHGQCLEDGCHCQAGWHGDDCSLVCAEGTYGTSCSSRCQCRNGADCDPVTGQCACRPGYTGVLCESVCPYSTYGQDCTNQCQCPDACFCDHVTGVCNTSSPAEYLQAGECLLQARIKKDSLVPDQSDQILHWTWATVSLVVVATVSIGLNVWLTSLVLKSRRDTQSGTTWRRRSRIPKHPASKTAVTGERLAVYAGHKSRECVGSSDADEETAFFDKTHGHSATP